jgi:hypothetical protein
MPLCSTVVGLLGGDPLTGLAQGRDRRKAEHQQYGRPSALIV